MHGVVKSSTSQMMSRQAVLEFGKKHKLSIDQTIIYLVLETLNEYFKVKNDDNDDVTICYNYQTYNFSLPSIPEEI